MENILDHNRKAWNRQVDEGNQWSVPVSHDDIEKARKGDWNVVLTPWIPVPREWFGEISGKDILCLASAGGQQVPVFASAGANVTSYDLSDKQLEQDKKVAHHERLNIIFQQGDMRDLSVFDDESFDMIFHPVSNCFVPDVNPVWKESYRVLRKGGVLLAGFANPLLYLFDESDPDKPFKLEIVNKIPYSDVDSLSEELKTTYEQKGYPFEFGHTFNDLIGGQLKAGFSIDGFYEDRHHDKTNPLHEMINVFVATRAVKK